MSTRLGAAGAASQAQAGAPEAVMHGRLPWLGPGGLTPEQRALYDRIAHGPRSHGPQAFPLVDDAGRLEGPFNALLYAPHVGTAVADLGAAIRFGSGLSERVREIAILELAALRRCDFEWYAHERVGRAAGLDDAELEAIRTGVPAASFDASEALVRQLVSALCLQRDVAAETLEEARALLGPRALVELIALVGYYDLLALGLRIWRTPLPAGAAAPFASQRALALTFDIARSIVDVAHAYARAREFAPLAVAILDERGTLRCFGAEDGTSLGRGDIAIGKASGALAMGFGSRSIAKRARDNPHFYASLASLVRGGLVPVPGGVLIRASGGELLGAVGISGDVADRDEAAAIAGVTAVALVADAGTE